MDAFEAAAVATGRSASEGLLWLAIVVVGLAYLAVVVALRSFNKPAAIARGSQSQRPVRPASRAHV